MYIFLTILIVIVSILLILLVMVQNSKGGGLASGFSGGNQVMGAPRTADFLEKASWTLVSVIVALSIIAVGVHKGQAVMDDETQSAIHQQVDDANAALPQALPQEQATEQADQGE